MQKFISLLVLLTFGSAHAAGTPTKFPGSDLIQFGVASSTSSKSIEFNTNDGGNNVTVTVDDSRNVSINTTGSTALKSNDLLVGNGVSGNKSMKFDVGSGVSNPGFRYDSGADKIYFRTVGSPEKSIGSGSGGGSGINLLQDNNPDFEAFGSGVFANWTGSVPGTITQATSGSNLLIGLSSAVFNSTAASQTFTSDAINVTTSTVARLGGSKVAAYCSFKTAAVDYEIQAWDGTNVLARRTIPALSAQQIIGTSSFSLPTSGTVAIRIVSASDAVDLAIDNCALGTTNEVDISQAQFYGSLTTAGTASCDWNTSSGSYADFSADADCPTPVATGRVTAPPTLVPNAVLNNHPAGTFGVTFTGTVFGEGNGVAYQCRLVDSAGTQLVSYGGSSILNDGGGNNARVPTELTGYVTYSTSGSHTISLQCKNGSTVHVAASVADQNARFSVVMFPSEAQVVQKFDTVGQRWSGYHANDCEFQRGSASFGAFTADAGCTFTTRNSSNIGTVSSTGSKTPGVTWQPNSVGTYRVCASGAVYSSASSGYANLRLVDGLGVAIAGGPTQRNETNTHPSPFTICGDLVVTSAMGMATVELQGKDSGGTINVGASANLAEVTLEWTIEKKGEQVPAPLVSNAIVSSRSGLTRLAEFAFGAAGGTHSAPAPCLSSPCTVYSGDVGSVTRSSAGSYSVSWNPSLFSGTPNCSWSITNWAGSDAGCSCQQVSSSSSTLVFSCVCASASQDVSMSGLCSGPR